MVQLTGNCSQGQQVEVLILGLVREIGLVAFADAVPLVLVLQNVAGEQRFMVIGHQAGREYGVGGLDVPIAAINANDTDLLSVLI